MSNTEHSIDKENLPTHIAIIMDGNGRWAKEKGKNRIFGHHEGVKTVRRITELCAEIGIKYLTLYAFSTENWQRPIEEVNALMELLVNTINAELGTLQKNNISLQMIGDINKLPKNCHKGLMHAKEQTSKNTGLNLILALSYSARWDITQATKQVAEMVLSGKLEASDINENIFKQKLTTAPYPDPELLIRTSGEHRISNFLLWEMAYSELYFCDKNWPDFSKEELFKAITDYQRRERRFGRVSEQLNKG